MSSSEVNAELPVSAGPIADEKTSSDDNAEVPIPAGMAPAYGQAPQAPAYAQAPPASAPQAPAPVAPAPAPVIINIQQNAGGFNWAPPPAPAAIAQANCPVGMEYFLGINSITVHQQISAAENCSSLCCPCIAPCVHDGNEYTVSELKSFIY